MSFSAPQRAALKIKIARKLSESVFVEIDAILLEFGISAKEGSYPNTYFYALEMLNGIDDITLTQLAELFGFDVDPALETNLPLSKETTFPTFWKNDSLKVFISHISQHKEYASELQAELEKFGITAFVAHEDIEPDEAWQDEIEKALKTCDSLIALLHPNFNQSTWTDQEIGFALGRGIPVFSVRLGMDPYGLFGRKQAFNGNQKKPYLIADELFEAYIKHEKTAIKVADMLVNLFVESDTFAKAKKHIGLLEKLSHWKQDYNKRLGDAVDENDQIKNSFGVPERVRILIETHS